MQHCYGPKTELFFVLLLGVIFSGCSPQEIKLDYDNTGEMLPLYIIKPSGPEPFYFELGPDGPELISSLAEASATPFLPWPYGRYIPHFLPVRSSEDDEEQILFAAINRGGILEFRNYAGKINVYYHPGGTIWENFPLVAFFRNKQNPAALFTGERFFSTEEVTFPDHQVWILENSSIKEGIIPALNNKNPDIIKINAVFLGNDEIWYIRKNSTEGKTSYFRTFDFSQPGQEVSAELYLEASSPLMADSPLVPPLLARAITEAERMAGKPCVAAVSSPDFPANRLFGSSITAEGTAKGGINDEFPLELSGFYRQQTSGIEAEALFLFPDGRGVYYRSTGTEIKDEYFNLPALPSGDFVYTGVALLGEIPGMFLIAAWEEQNNWNIGAAGFLLLEIDR